jgi:hypothetical protein
MHAMSLQSKQLQMNIGIHFLKRFENTQDCNLVSPTLDMHSHGGYDIVLCPCASLLFPTLIHIAIRLVRYQ